MLIIYSTSSVLASNNWATGTFKRHMDTKLTSATLDITNVTDTWFTFKINSSNGANIGNASGTAYIDGNSAILDDCKGGILKFMSSECMLKIDQSGEMTYYAGAGVIFSGDYTSTNAIEENQDDVLFFTLHEVFSANQEQVFIDLVRAQYKNFTNTGNLFTNAKDLDNLGAHVHKMGVRGLFTIMESIIMIRDSDNSIWAAVIDNDNVLYFTNTQDVQIPITIEQWRARFKDKMVVQVVRQF